jgi:predicted LPLAT superfamily acyltransferase
LQIFVFPVVFSVFIFSKPVRVFSRKYLNRIYEFKIKQGEKSLKKPNGFSAFWHIFSFADSLMDKMISWSGKIDFDQINIKDQSEFDSLMGELKNDNPPFLICSHLGNMEVLRAIGNFYTSDLLGRKLEVHSVVQAGHTPKFTNFLRKINPKAADNLTATANMGIDAVIDLKEKLQSGKMIVIAGDRTAAKNENRSIAVDFLGTPAYFPIGSFTLASLMESPIYFIFCLKGKGGKYDLYLQRTKVDFDCTRSVRKERVKDLMQEYSAMLEKLCLKYPNQWYNFFDFWKS